MQPVKYKKPRRINSVSITLLLFAIAVVYLAYQWIPIVFLKYEANRILEEAGSKMTKQAKLFQTDRRALEQLRGKLRGDLYGVGVDDPQVDVWIEFENNEARIGTVYSVWVHWPFDILKPHEVEYQMEHVVHL